MKTKMKMFIRSRCGAFLHAVTMKLLGPHVQALLVQYDSDVFAVDP